MIRKLNYYMWCLFFYAYWTVYDLGEKSKPQNNAKSYIGFTIFLNLLIPFHILMILGNKFSGLTVVLFCFIPGFFLPHLLFRKKKIEAKFKEFEFLKDQNFKRRRILTMLFIAILSVATFFLLGILQLQYAT